MSDVQYRPIPGFPGYRAGSDGTVWSDKPYKGSPRGTWRLLKQGTHTGGYRTIWLRPAGEQREGGRPIRLYVHRLILETFVGACPEGMEGCHGNGDRSDNRLSNLRWDTHAGNAGDMILHGTRMTGEKNPHAKLSAADIPRIVADHMGGMTFMQIGEKYGISYTTARKIARGLRWRHVDRPADTTTLLNRNPRRGEACGRAVLNDESVRAIRLRLQAGESAASIARAFGVTDCTILFIKWGQTWKHVA